MAEHKGQTGQIHKIKLPSALSVVMWSRRSAAPGGTVHLQVFCRYVGNDADMKIELTDASGKNFGTFTGKVYGNRFSAPVRVPPDARDQLFANVKLSKHGLSGKSEPLLVLPRIEITNAKWDKDEVHRGEILKLTADVKGVPDGVEALIEVWENDEEGAHDFVTKFQVLVKNKKVEAEWEYSYSGKTRDIPTKDELQKVGKEYIPPTYFFRVRVGEVAADSGLLRFKDWIEFTVKDLQGNPLANKSYTITFAEGSKESGKLDELGHVRIQAVSPGPYVIEVEGAGKLLGDGQ